MQFPVISTVTDPQIKVKLTSTEATNTATSTITSATTTTTNGYVNKWVRNLSGTPLTEAQVSLLVHGPNSAVALRHPLWGIHHCNRAGLSEARAIQCRGT